MPLPQSVVLIIAILIIAVVVLVVLLLRSRRRFAQVKSAANEAVAGASAVQQKYGAITDVAREVTRISAERDRLAAEVEAGRRQWEQQYQIMVGELQRLTGEVELMGGLAELQSFGLYEPYFDFDTSERYKDAIVQNREARKAAIKAGHAAVCDTVWTVEGSAAKGRKMVEEMLRLLLRAFNGSATPRRGRFDSTT